jgi:putative salt-induced outer membrane protein YdiY
MPRAIFSVVPTVTLLALALAHGVSAQAGPFSWENATELSFVSSSGNSSSNTLGLKSSLDGSNDVSSFKLEIGGIRASSSFTTRTAVGTMDAFVVTEETRTEPSAANYFARSRYTRDIGAVFTFGGVGWERNTFSGMNHRFSLVSGLGRTWVESDAALLKTDLGGTYTIQRDIEEDPTRDDGFAGLRATIEATRSLTATTDLATTLVVDENVSETDDLRLDWVASITVALTEGLAFKTSYQVLFDNLPALVAVPLFDGVGAPAGQVVVPSSTVDSFVTLSLVIKL